MFQVTDDECLIYYQKCWKDYFPSSITNSLFWESSIFLLKKLGFESLLSYITLESGNTLSTVAIEPGSSQGLSFF